MKINSAIPITEQSDRELLMMLSFEREQHSSDTLVEAAAEFKKRNLTEKDIVRILKEGDLPEKPGDSAANEDLGLIGRIFSFVLPGILLFTYARWLQSNGYYRKARSVRTWTTYGLGFYITLSVLAEILSIL